jgi:N-methylhydantoinase A
MTSQKKYLIATDVGGTCTDTVVFAFGEPIRLGKALSTPPNFANGVLDSVSSAAKSMGLSLIELISQAALFVHGSTVVDNAILTRDGSKVGLITTEGFEDTLLITRGGYGRWSGLTEEKMKNMVKTERAESLVDRNCIVGVPERVDYKGSVIRDLDEEFLEISIKKLLQQGVQALAVSFLWSFYNPKHENRVLEIVNRIDPSIYCTLSSKIAPTPGEYERTSTTVINAYAGNIAKNYIQSLEVLLNENGYDGPLMIMQGYGGLLPSSEAADRAIGMLECGPAAGVIGSKALGNLLNQPDVIATDMGGTTFKVSVIQDGEIEYAREPMIERYHYSQPKIEVVSIGAGGGSIVWIEPGTNTPRVGPRSAGSTPGPVCYGLGGTEPTLTDVFMLIGYMDPTIFLGGTMHLDKDAARRVFEEKIAQPLNLSVEEAAFGIYRIACAQITDLIREITIERGHDPRDFVLHAFGGSCGIVCGMFGAELGVKKIVIPYTASVNCAFGLVSADIVHEYNTVQTLPMPSPIEIFENIFEPMREKALSDLHSEGFAGDKITLEWAVDLRYSRQVHEVTTKIRSEVPLTESGLRALADDFESLYERKYGKGSAFREAGIEMTQFRLKASGLLEHAELTRLDFETKDSAPAKIGEREIFVEARSSMFIASIYDFNLLKCGNVITGPAVIHTPITTIVLQEFQQAEYDEYQNIIIEFLENEGSNANA